MLTWPLAAGGMTPSGNTSTRSTAPIPDGGAGGDGLTVEPLLGLGDPSYKRHRTNIPSLSYSSGGVVAHSLIAWLQRGWNRQPEGGAPRSGGEPGIPMRGTFGPLIDGYASSSPWEYGCLGAPNSRLVGPSSATCPAYITMSRSEN